MANKKITINGISIGEDDPVFLIAEIGLNHNGSIDIAKRLIDAAFACGWNCVKFQKRTPHICVPDNQKNIIRETPWGKITYLEYRYKVEFEKHEYNYIDKYCKEKPLIWSASVWDLPSLKFILEFDAPFIKIPSAKLTDWEILKAAAKSRKPVFLSTGMSTIKEIDVAVNLLEKNSAGDFLLMHTNSTYPTPIDELNLRVIDLLKNRYGCLVGYSGHEYGVEPSVIASIIGAVAVERHVTLDHSMWGSDHFASLEIEGMFKLPKRIHSLKDMLGSGEKKVSINELKIREKLRGV